MAGSYFADAEENYYTRDQSAADEWQGKLCEKLGLQDGAAVKAEDFQVILSARGSKCAGYDLTFLAPKSVSIVPWPSLNTTCQGTLIRSCTLMLLLPI